MKTFNVTVAIDTTIIVPEAFIRMNREAATSEDASPFYKQLQEQFPNSPDDDEEFIKAVLKNGLRHSVREHLKSLYSASGLGGRLAPTHVRIQDYSPPAVHAPQCDDEEVTQSPA